VGELIVASRAKCINSRTCINSNEPTNPTGVVTL
jgi:hypothetical protein